jgi:hypothetical protein
VHPLKWLRAHVAHEWVNIVAAMIVATATVVYTYVAYSQWRTMRDQLAEMRSSSEQTAATIAALQEQAAALKTQLGLLQDSNHISETALASNLRAWLAPGAIVSNTDLGNSAFPTLQVDILNFGRQPAENIIASLHLDYGDMSKEKDVSPTTFPVWSEHANELAWESSCKSAQPSDGTALVYPSAQAQMSTTVSDRSIDLREIRAARKLLVVWGCFGYRTFGTVHHTSLCEYLNPDPARSIREWTYRFCPAGNHAD